MPPLEPLDEPAKCSRFCMMQCGCCCIALGVVLISFGSLTPLMIDTIIDGNARRAVVLESTTDDLDHFDLWSSSQPEDAFLNEKFYFFNVTNPADVMAGDEPALRDVGPYAVRKDKKRQLKRFEDTLGEVMYDEWQYVDWDTGRTRAGLSPTDVITTVNLPYAMMRRTLLPDASGARVEADLVLRGGLGYYLLERTITTALEGGINSIWTVTKDPSANFCDYIDCGAHGTCSGLGVCDCQDGYSGPECRDPPDLCKDVDCSVNGLCDAATGACQCFNRWFGDRCETYPTSTTCASSDFEQDTCRGCCMLTCGADNPLYSQSTCKSTSVAQLRFTLPCTCTLCNAIVCSDAGSSTCTGTGCVCNTGFDGDRCDRCTANRYGPTCVAAQGRVNQPNAAISVEFTKTDMDTIVTQLLAEPWGTSAGAGVCAVTTGGTNTNCAGATTDVACTAASTAGGVTGAPHVCVFTGVGGGRPGTAIQAFVAPNGQAIAGLSADQNTYLRLWLLYQVDQLATNELKNEMMITNRSVTKLIYGYSMHDVLVRICAGWCEDPGLVSGWAREGLLGPYHHNDNHTFAGRRSPTFAVKRRTRHNTGTLDLPSAWSISMRDGRRIMHEWPGNGTVGGKDVEYGYLGPRLTEHGAVRDSETAHLVWVERGLRSATFVYDTTEQIGGIDALLYTMDPLSWKASTSNRQKFGMNADWDPTGTGGTWLLRAESSPSCPNERCSRGLRLPGCSYSMPYAFAKAPRVAGLTQYSAGAQRTVTQRSTGTASANTHSLVVGTLDYNHRESMAAMAQYSHVGSVNSSTAMHPSWAGLRSYLLVEPITGFMLEAAIRLQLNVELPGTGLCVERAHIWDGTASVAADATACAAVASADLRTASACESIMTTGADLNSGAITSINAGSANTVTLVGANTNIKPGQYMQILDSVGLCAALPKGTDMLVSSVSTDGRVITFATDISRGDAAATTNCLLTRTTTACAYNPHGSVFTRGLNPQLFPMMWVDTGGRESDEQLEGFKSSVYGAIKFGQKILVVFILLGCIQSVLGAACCVCRAKHMYGGVYPMAPMTAKEAGAWSTPTVRDPTDRWGSVDSRQGGGGQRGSTSSKGGGGRRGSVGTGSRGRSRSRGRPSSRGSSVSSRGSSRASSRASSRGRSQSRERNDHRRGSVDSSRSGRSKKKHHDRDGERRPKKVTKHRLPREPKPPSSRRGDGPSPRRPGYRDYG